MYAGNCKHLSISDPRIARDVGKAATPAPGGTQHVTSVVVQGMGGIKAIGVSQDGKPSGIMHQARVGKSLPAEPA